MQAFLLSTAAPAFGAAFQTMESFATSPQSAPPLVKPPTFGPPIVASGDANAALVTDGFALLDGDGVEMLTGAARRALDALAATWEDLPPDRYLKDGGAYRQRRHASLIVDGERMMLAPHRAHWQPVEYNALHGGMRRWFEPIADRVIADDDWSRLLVGLGRVFATVRPVDRWFVEAHQFRIDTANGIGRPTPEGAHRDGVDFVAVILIGRHHVKGGETRVFDANGPRGQRFTMIDPWTTLLLDDARVIHETTPVQPLDDAVAADGRRDTLVLTYRAGGFQGDATVD